MSSIPTETRADSRTGRATSAMVIASLVVVAVVGIATVGFLATRSSINAVVVSPSEVEHFDSPRDLASRSDLVVVGTVTAIEPSRVIPGEVATQVVNISVEVKTVLQGNAPDHVSFQWEIGEVDTNGDLALRYLRNGVPAPQLGETFVLFLKVFPAVDAAREPNPSTHYLPTVNGILEIDGETVRSKVDQANALGHDIADLGLAGIEEITSR